jgi:hypothetical protein
VAYLGQYKWVCILFKDANQLEIFDITKGGELVTHLKSKNLYKITAFETFEGRIMCTATRDYLLNLYEPDPHDPSVFRL